MSEQIIQIKTIDPVAIYGVNDIKLDLIRKHFPELKIIARGDEIKIIGETKGIEKFENKFNQLLDHFHKYGSITENNIETLMANGELNPAPFEEEKLMSGEVLLHGVSGKMIRARTPNHFKMAVSIDKNDMVFAIGPAGSGKTYTAVALAVKALKNREVRRLILTRPAVEAGENLGFLPGDLKEKLDPYMQPLYDALRDMIPIEKLAVYLETKVIEIAPLAFMRGRTLDDAFVILDEAQNTTQSQLKMFLSRMGTSAKFIITGDVTQIDLPRNQPSGLVQAQKILSGIKGIEFIYLDNNDIVRHHLVKKILEAYEVNLSRL
jgi:phosphate starvation-inducible PhoH-like protein